MAISNQIACTGVNQLQEFTMIASGSETLEFEVFYTNGEPVDLQSVSSIYWCLSRYGNPQNTVLKKEDYLIYGINKFQIKLNPEDTEFLSGKYIQQPVIVDYKGNPYRFAQGVINVIPAII